MARQQDLPEKGAASAEELYLQIGSALSLWEASEDIIIGIFRAICEGIEPVSIEAFLHAPRNVRSSMLSLAMRTYSFRFEQGEIAKVEKALKALDRLASTRNELAHGFVVQVEFQDQDTVKASGFYVLPSLNESGYLERSLRYHHTTDTINIFTAGVRKCRSELLEVQRRAFMDGQRRKAVNGSVNVNLWDILGRMYQLETTGADALDELKRTISRMEEMDKRQLSAPR